MIPVIKRLIDVTICGAALVALAPVFLIAALLVKLSSPGPVFYKAKRAGYQGRPFELLKFRTMHVGADRHGAITGKSDPRVFPAGRIIRRLKIDELPQIMNVLKGEMTLVGPRPEDVGIVRSCYGPAQLRVLDVVPGLTGLPQVRFYPEFPVTEAAGMNPEEYYCKVILPMRLEMDLDYVRRQSLWLDLQLIFTTIYLIGFKSWCLPLADKLRPSLLPTGKSA